MHRTALVGLSAVGLSAMVIGHWAKRLARAWQVWGLLWPRERSLGLLGLTFSWFAKSEQLHYWVALVMLVAGLVLRLGPTEPAPAWWDVALGLLFWHHVRHFLLCAQLRRVV